MPTGEQVAAALAPQLQEHLQDMAANAKANAIPLPGALRDAFAIAPEIKVGPYVVRPFYDADFEFLQILDHPLHQMIVASQAGGEVDSSKHKRSSMWELFFIFTSPIDEVDALFEKGEEGLVELRRKARKSFSRMQGGAVLALDAAIGLQLKRYWDPCIGYDENAEGNGEEAKSTANFTRATGDCPPTVSAGLSTSVAA